MIFAVVIHAPDSRYYVRFEADDEQEHTLATLSLRTLVPYNLRSCDVKAGTWIIDREARTELEYWADYMYSERRAHVKWICQWHEPEETGEPTES